MRGLEINVIPVTSQIHAQTFAMALGGNMGSSQPGAIAFFVGVDPSCANEVNKSKQKGMKTVAYWIGSDSLCACTNADFRKNIPEFDLHVCVHNRIKDELATWGIKAHTVWPCPRIVHPKQKIKQLAIGVYQPTPYINKANDLYCFDECITIAKELPDWRFLFYGAKYKSLPKNVIDIGRLEPNGVSDLYSKMSCVLRLTKHDGHPLGAIEAKMKGLHVIENYPYEGFLLATTLNHVKMLIEDEETHQGDDSFWPELYQKECSPNNFKKKIFDLL